MSASVADGPVAVRQVMDGWRWEWQIMEHREAIGTISIEATQEANLEQMLSKVKAAWESTDFVVNP